MKKWLAHALVVILPLLGAPAAAGESACSEFDILHPERFAADPTTFAAAWLPDIERLYEAIPFLSPREERWLEEELDSVRSVSALNSREFAVRSAKRRLGADLDLTRRLTEERDRAAQARDLLWFAYALIDADTALFLARLEAEGVIQRGAIPFMWKLYVAEGKGGAALQEAILWGRTRLARHVLSCTLPSVLGVSMEPLPWRTNPALRAR